MPLNASMLRARNYFMRIEKYLLLNSDCFFYYLAILLHCTIQWQYYLFLK